MSTQIAIRQTKLQNWAIIIKTVKNSDLVFLLFAARMVFPDMLTITDTKKLRYNCMNETVL